MPSNIDTLLSSPHHAAGYQYPAWELLLAELAGIPWAGSPEYLKDSNGYFDCEVIRDTNDAISSIGLFRMSPGVAVI